MQNGFTLIEILVVLVLMGLGAAIVLPSLRTPADEDPAPVADLVGRARAVAVGRGESVVLRVDATGQWRIDGPASRAEGALLRGRLDAGIAEPMALHVSPLGTCAPAPEWRGPAGVRPDPLTCEVRSP